MTNRGLTGRASTHAELQGQAVDLAHSLGWRHLHVRKSIGKGKHWVTATNVVGWPDLLLWHPARGGICAVEVKVGTDLTPEQAAVLAELRDAGIPTLVVVPDGIDDLKEFLIRWRAAPMPLATQPSQEDA